LEVSDDGYGVRAWRKTEAGIVFLRLEEKANQGFEEYRD
jgi:hypothetical protein